MSYIYFKAQPQDPSKLQRQFLLTNFLGRLKKLLPTIMITVGASLLISVGYPIVSFELMTGRNTQHSRIVSPIDPTQPQVLANQPQVAQVGNAMVDYNQVSSWFNFAKPQAFLNPSNATSYTISIPKLRISEATVTIGSNNLDNSLIQYGGTANPGEIGNPVIFGHSILPQFYNPKSYRSIFSLIPTLKPGDEILVNFDGIAYKYNVYDYYEVSPEEIDILEQRYNQKELTLVTCVPPGTYWRRGIVKARLSEI